MPFKTQYGTHYHMTEGCSGATIPCGTEGLEPCSICCGGGHGTDGGGSAVAGGGTGTAGEGEFGRLDESQAPGQTDMLGVIAKACDSGDSVELPNGNTLIFREAWETGFSEDGYVIEEPRHGVPLRPATASDLQEAARQLRDGIATLGSGADWHDYAPETDRPSETRRDSIAGAVKAGAAVADLGVHGAEPLSMPRETGSLDLSVLESMGTNGTPAVAPIPPMPRNLGNGTYIDVDGTIVRGEGIRDMDGGTREAIQRRASELVRRFDGAAPARHPSPDYAERARHDLVGRIDGATDQLPETRREEFRRTAQATWNTMHPEAPVLEWSRDDEGYVSDSKESVVTRWRNYNEMREFNGGSNEIGYDYGVFDKATGNNVTDELHHRDVVMRQVNRRIDDVELEIKARAQREAMAQRSALYGEWLEERRRHSNAFKYHGGSYSWQLRDELSQEFERDTGYTFPENPQTRPTDEEREELAELYQRQRDARRALDDMMLRYGVDEETLVLIRPQYSQRFGR